MSIEEVDNKIVYQKLSDIELQEAGSDDNDEDTVHVFVQPGASHEEVIREVTKGLERRYWWLQEEWRSKGIPRESITFTHPLGNLEVYCFGDVLSDQQLGEITEVIKFYSNVLDGRVLTMVKYVLVDNESEVNINSGERALGKYLGTSNAVKIHPEALPNLPHRVNAVSLLTGTLTHEFAHSFARELSGRWVREFGWQDAPAGQNLPGGAMKSYLPSDEDSFITEYARCHPQEDICDSVDREITWQRFDGDHLVLPKISNPVKYKKRTIKKFK